MINKNKKEIIQVLEELELDLIELEAYRSLDSQSFNFGDEELKNDNSCGFGSEDVYYKIEINNILDRIDELEDLLHKPINKKSSSRHKGYKRKMYYKKIKPIKSIKTYSPWYLYRWDFEIDKPCYWKRNYVANKFSKNYSNRIVRRIPIYINEENAKKEIPCRGNGFRHSYDYWWDIL